MIGRLLCGLGLHARGALVTHRIVWSRASSARPSLTTYERCPRCGHMEPVSQEVEAQGGILMEVGL